jgi:hypothetical protein
MQQKTHVNWNYTKGNKLAAPLQIPDLIIGDKDIVGYRLDRMKALLVGSIRSDALVLAL